MPSPSCFVTVTTRMMFDTSKSVKLCCICHTDVLLCLEHTRGDIILPVSGHLGIPSHNNFSSINLFLCVTELPTLCAAICSGSGHSNGDSLSSDSRTGWSAGLNTENCLSVGRGRTFLPFTYHCCTNTMHNITKAGCVSEKRIHVHWREAQL